MTRPVDGLRAALDQVALWRHFRHVATEEELGMVLKLLRHADALLSRIVETFPTYTLHDRTHAVNVAHLMGKLVESRLSELSGLETALLLLSAFWHDLGMVFSEEEREKAADSEEFHKFIDMHPEARLEIAEFGAVTQSVMEWFCRWNHADRVLYQLDKLGDTQFEWRGVSIRQQLGTLCRSHNLPVAHLTNDDLCPTDFLVEADIRFCAVILRLADILDFDRSRSPDAIYHYIGVGRRIDQRQTLSDVEWLKHLQSNGFVFPAIALRSTPYSLGFIAAPNHPAVEWDVRAFLDVIEGELLSSQQLIRNCGPRWLSMALPIRIQRNNIHSQNFKFGDYRFVLDQEQVLGLLMGENLYEDPYVFVRELIQNAIDASRHREFEERRRGKVDFRAEPIHITEWYDNEQYRWIRVDDSGMGMTEEIIYKFLLGVGRSFYTSAEFLAQQLQYTEGVRFVPISRFGIGILSCFIAGDRVEISTRHATSATIQRDSIRLSLEGIHGFFTLQTGNHTPTLMPSANGLESGYRLQPGTSVAVRLDPKKDFNPIGLDGLLRRWILHPPVQVKFETRMYGGNPQDLSDGPWIDDVVQAEITEEECKAAFSELMIEAGGRVVVQIATLDLTAHAANGNLRGKLLAIKVRLIEPRKKRGRNQRIARDLELSISADKLVIVSRARLSIIGRHSVDTVYDEEEKRVQKHFRYARGARIDATMIWQQVDPEVRNKAIQLGKDIKLSHNGIRIPDRIRNDAYGSSLFVSSNSDWLIFGAIDLLDSLRPDLSVSRDELKSISPSILFSIELAFRRAVTGNSALKLAVRDRLMVAAVTTDTTFGKLIVEPTINEGFWDDEPMFTILSQNFLYNKVFKDHDDLSVNQIKFLLDNFDVPVEIKYVAGRGAVETVSRVLLSRTFDCTLLMGAPVVDTRLSPPQVLLRVRHRIQPMPSGAMLFPPLTFVSFSNPQVLRYAELEFLNSEHEFAKWILNFGAMLATRLPALSRFLQEQLIREISFSEVSVSNWGRAINSAIKQVQRVDRNLDVPFLVPGAVASYKR